MNECTCTDWQSNVLIIKTHFGEAFFRFCPWCGQRLTDGKPDPDLLKKYRQRIKDHFFSDDGWGMPQGPNMLLAARPIEDYRQFTGDMAGILDLMLTFVETGTQFTNTYGDIDEPFYEGLETMLDDFRDLLLANPTVYESSDLSSRLTKLVREGGYLGWGYGDYITDQVHLIQQKFGDV